jgi:hypothetical protein
MTTRKSILLGAAVVGGAVLWYVFRPDTLFVNRSVSEPFPVMDAPATEHSAMLAAAAEPVPLTSGRFHTNAHETNGMATIYRLPDGRRVLRLTEFATSNGPDVRVYLVAADDVQDEDAAKSAGFVDLGALKGNVGDQNYDVPADLDLSGYRAVSIWCRRFSVNFGAAPLLDATS